MYDREKRYFEPTRACHVEKSVNETVSLAIWVEKEGPLVVEWVESKKPMNINVRTGFLVEVTSTAIGGIFAAFLPEEKTKNIIQKELVASIFIVGLTESINISKDSTVVKDLLITARQLSESLR